MHTSLKFLQRAPIDYRKPINFTKFWSKYVTRNIDGTKSYENNMVNKRDCKLNKLDCK